MKESLSEQEEVSTRRSRRTSKRVQDSNFVFIWFRIPDLQIYLLARPVQRTFDEDKHENQMFRLSLVYWFSYYLRCDSQQTTNKARYDAICVQECPNLNIWGYGLSSKRFEGSRLYSKQILGLLGSDQVITPSIFMTATICSVALIYVWKINPVNLKVLVREKININTAKVHYLSY